MLLTLKNLIGIDKLFYKFKYKKLTKKQYDMKTLETIVYYLVEDVNWKKWSFLVILLGAITLTIGGVYPKYSWSIWSLIIGNVLLGVWFLKTLFENILAIGLGRLFKVKNSTNFANKLFLISYPIIFIAIAILKIIGISLDWLYPVLWVTIASISAFTVE